MKVPFVEKKRIRKSFGKIKNVTSLPNLIEIQKRSFDSFLQLGTEPSERLDYGLHEYVSYDFGQPKYDVIECSQRGMTFSVPLKSTFKLIVWDIDEETGTKSVRDIKQQEVYMCDIPLMTKNGTFIINGVERVVVSQMHRSPGVFFDHDRGKTHISGKYLFSCRRLEI